MSQPVKIWGLELNQCDTESQQQFSTQERLRLTERQNLSMRHHLARNSGGDSLLESLIGIKLCLQQRCAAVWQDRTYSCKSLRRGKGEKLWACLSHDCYLEELKEHILLHWEAAMCADKIKTKKVRHRCYILVPSGSPVMDLTKKRKMWILSTLCLDRWQAKPRVTHSATFLAICLRSLRCSSPRRAERQWALWNAKVAGGRAGGRWT